MDRMKTVLSTPVVVGPYEYSLILHTGGALNDAIYSTPTDILIAAQESLD